MVSVAMLTVSFEFNFSTGPTWSLCWSFSWISPSYIDSDNCMLLLQCKAHGWYKLQTSLPAAQPQVFNID